MNKEGLKFVALFWIFVAMLTAYAVGIVALTAIFGATGLIVGFIPFFFGVSYGLYKMEPEPVKVIRKKLK